MKTFLQEFREFAMKGNIVDLAVAVIIGAAFGKIVASLVEDIVMPAIGEGGQVVAHRDAGLPHGHTWAHAL